VQPVPDQPLALYRRARQQRLGPALLESLGSPTPFGRLTLLGVRRTRRLELWDGVLYDDGVPAGGIDELFAHLEAGRLRSSAPTYFPCWIGFFAYEFARHLGLPTQAPMPGLPDAAFFWYPEGYAWLRGELVERPADEPVVWPEAQSPVDLYERAATTGPAGSADIGHRPPLGTYAREPLVSVPIESDFDPDHFIAGVEEVQERIRAGWVYQVNLSHRFHFSAQGIDPLLLYEHLRPVNPSPFMGLLEGDGWAVVSGSPERLFNYVDGVMTARPIAGTRPRSVAPDQDAALEAELRADPKEQAEHVMLVDLLRNDLSRVCAPGSVEVSEAFTVERYSHVMHLVSEVRGRTAAPLGDLVRAIFPGGTITGAPKESVMREIARLEPVPRGAYTGSLGYISGAGVDFNILIRSFTLTGCATAGDRRATAGDRRATAGDRCATAGDARGYVSGGGGIVIGSDPFKEYLETRHKVEAQLHVLGSGRLGVAPATPSRLTTWRPPQPRAVPAARVLFVEAHDSFSYNIINYLLMLGATVRVVDHAAPPSLGEATHVVAGPGPGDPPSSGRLLDWVAAALAARLPFLGVCLGHQALGVLLGATLQRAPRPVHGESHAVRHTGQGLFAGLPSPASFTRYHSLCLTDLPYDLEAHAWTSDEVIMAVAHRELPAWGVQFHPESMLSPHGLDLLANFLEVEGRHERPVPGKERAKRATRGEARSRPPRRGARS